MRSYFLITFLYTIDTAAVILWQHDINEPVSVCALLVFPLGAWFGWLNHVSPARRL